MRVAEADADVVGVDEGDGRRVVAQVDHLDDVVGRPADQEQRDDHQHHLGGSFSPDGLLAFNPADGAEDVVEGERVKGADDDEGDDVAKDGLVESVPVHVLGPVQVHHADLQTVPTLNLGVHHDRDGEEEAAQPHQYVDHDGPVDGPFLRGGVDYGYVPRRKKSLFTVRLQTQHSKVHVKRSLSSLTRDDKTKYHVKDTFSIYYMLHTVMNAAIN